VAPSCASRSFTPSITGPRQSGAAIAAETELEKKPERRFGSVRELREELDGTAERRREEENPKEKKRKRNLAAVAPMLFGGTAIIWCLIGRGGVNAQVPKGSIAQQSANRDSLINSMEIEFVSIPAGRFMMGCSQGDEQCYADEKPQYEVQITRSFQLGKYEVTQGQWAKVMGSNPSKFKGEDRLPVEEVSWNDVQRFIAKLNALNDGYRYRLPTEAEWEYAARGGTTGVYYGNLDAIGWYEENSGSKTHPVGQKQPNGFGLYDMLGNVWEWCSDGYDKSYYGSSPGSDPKGPDSAQGRVLRGGSWDDISSNARASSRVGVVPFVRGNAIGFRVCREPR
jgi:formylglycine-generating enzyme required for sulfatase activity